MMKKAKNKNNNVCKCAVCGSKVGNDCIGTPFGTVVCLECAYTLHQMMDQVIKGNMRKGLFAQKVPSTNKPEYNPVVPLFVE